LKLRHHHNVVTTRNIPEDGAEHAEEEELSLTLSHIVEHPDPPRSESPDSNYSSISLECETESVASSLTWDEEDLLPLEEMIAVVGKGDNIRSTDEDNGYKEASSGSGIPRPMQPTIGETEKLSLLDSSPYGETDSLDNHRRHNNSRSSRSSNISKEPPKPRPRVSIVNC
jgi:hypothetical protein